MRARIAVAVLAALLALAGRADAQTPIVAARVKGVGPIVDPAAALWKLARPVPVAMLPQTVTLPH